MFLCFFVFDFRTGISLQGNFVLPVSMFLRNQNQFFPFWCDTFLAASKIRFLYYANLSELISIPPKIISTLIFVQLEAKFRDDPVEARRLRDF